MGSKSSLIFYFKKLKRLHYVAFLCGLCCYLAAISYLLIGNNTAT
ncbi:hypothetical protein PMAN_b0301 [Pseudoalteromonas marina]|nr:hypothetical protein PMAN_b0301 [Pseudoalteromonas marina]